MIEILNDSLFFSFPAVHPSAKLRITFERTLRLPNDGKSYLVQPSLGRLPVRDLDTLTQQVPRSSSEHGKVLLPMNPSEAMWLRIDSEYDHARSAAYPFAVKIATGNINAVTGGVWTGGLYRDPQQDYMVVPSQSSLEGYCVKKGVIRQFVARPPVNDNNADAQRVGIPHHEGLQIVVIPLKADIFNKRFPHKTSRVSPAIKQLPAPADATHPASKAAAGLVTKNLLQPEICEDPYKLSDWDKGHNSRCHVHITNSSAWRQITAEPLPKTPCTSGEYARCGVPWFMQYNDPLILPVERPEPAVKKGRGILENMDKVLIPWRKPRKQWQNRRGIITPPKYPTGKAGTKGGRRVTARNEFEQKGRSAMIQLIAMDKPRKVG